MNHALISGCMSSIRPKDIISSRIKADELFLTWLSQKETKSFIQELMTGQKPKSEKEGKRKGIQKAKSKNADKDSKKSPMSPRKITPPAEPRRMRQHRMSRERLTNELEKEESSVKSLFVVYQNNGITLDKLVLSIMEVLDIPKFLFPHYVKKLEQHSGKTLELDYNDFISFWAPTFSEADRTTRIFLILKNTSSRYIKPEDWVPPLKYLLDTHPGLEFLKGLPEYQERYIDTVIARIYFSVSRASRHRISLSDLKASNLIQCIYELQSRNDITYSPQYFDYKSHYVIYSNFIEIDNDRDSLISKDELASYQKYSITTKIIDRAYYLFRFKKGSLKKFSYQDFVWFMLAEEDKSYKHSIELWFRCLDYDDDGYWSPQDLYFFYEEQLYRMEFTILDSISFENALRQITDMINPKDPMRISLAEVIRSGYAKEIFNLLFNLSEFLNDEKRLSLIPLSREDKRRSCWEQYSTYHYDLALGESSSFYEDNDSEVVDYWASVDSDDSPLGTPRGE